MTIFRQKFNRPQDQEIDYRADADATDTSVVQYDTSPRAASGAVKDENENWHQQFYQPDNNEGHVNTSVWNVSLDTEDEQTRKVAKMQTMPEHQQLLREEENKIGLADQSMVSFGEPEFATSQAYVKLDTTAVSSRPMKQ